MSEDQNLEANGEEAVEGPDLSWVPEKFRENPQAFGEAYTNLERAYHQSRQEVKGLEDSITSLSSQFEEFTAAQNRPDPNNVLNQWAEQYDADPFSTTLRLAETIAQTTAQQILQQQQGSSKPAADPDIVGQLASMQLASQYEDWGEYVPKMQELIASDPLFADDRLWGDLPNATKNLDRVYKMVKAEDVLNGNTAAQQAQADTRAMKLGAQSAAGSAGRTPSVPSDVEEWEKIRQAGNRSYWQGLDK